MLLVSCISEDPVSLRETLFFRPMHRLRMGCGSRACLFLWRCEDCRGQEGLQGDEKGAGNSSDIDMECLPIGEWGPFLIPPRSGWFLLEG